MNISFCNWWEAVQISVPRRRPSHFLCFTSVITLNFLENFTVLQLLSKPERKWSVLNWFHVAYKRLIKRSRDGDFTHALGCLYLTCHKWYDTLWHLNISDRKANCCPTCNLPLSVRQSSGKLGQATKVWSYCHITAEMTVCFTTRNAVSHCQVQANKQHRPSF